jgi:hypothetical protein
MRGKFTENHGKMRGKFVVNRGYIWGNLRIITENCEGRRLRLAESYDLWFASGKILFELFIFRKMNFMEGIEGSRTRSCMLRKK